MHEIRSLTEAQREFSTQHKCEEYLARRRWPNGVTCPRCGRKHQHYMPRYRKWYCKHCDYQYSVTAGTIFHGTKLPLTKWMVALWFLCHSPKGCSAKQLERILGVHYETAWSMAHRLRKAMATEGYLQTFSGTVEIDDAIIKADGGRAFANVTYGAQHVVGMTSRETGLLRMVIVESLRNVHVKRVIAENLETVQAIISDATSRYDFVGRIAPHNVVAHYLTYADGDVHINFIENAWSLFKRGLVGIFHHVSAKYLQAYLDEFAFRYSHRHEKCALMDLVLASC